MSQHIQSVTVNEHGIVSNPTVVQTLEGVSTFQYTDKQEIILDDMMPAGTDQLHYLASVASMDPGHLTTVADASETVIATEVVQTQPDQQQTFEITLPVTTQNSAVAINHPATRYHINTVKVLKRTKEEVESGKQLYQCSACDKESNFTSNLYKHMKSNHSNCVIEKLAVPEKRSLLNMPPNINNTENQVNVSNSPSKSAIYLKCSACQKIFESVGEMKEHLKTHEADGSPKKSFEMGSVEDEIGHRNSNTVYVVKQDRGGINSGKPLYSCSACGKTSDSTGNLYKHMQAMHGDLTIEKITNTKRVSVEPVNDFMNTIGSPKKATTSPSKHSSGPVVKIVKSTKEQIECGMKFYSCSQCGKQSNFTSNLYKHMEACHQYHTIERLIKYQRFRGPVEPVELNTVKTADYDKTVYVVKSTTEEICNGEKPYRCSECGKGSEFTSNLYAHMDKQHPDCVVQTLKNNTNRRSVAPDPATLVGGNSTVTVVDVAPDHLGKKYKCSRCYLTTTSTGSLYKHMRRMHKGFAIIKKQRGDKDKPVRTEPKRQYTKRQKQVEFFDDYEYDYDDYLEEEEDYISFVAANVTFTSFECCLCSDLRSFNTLEDLDTHVQTDHADCDKENDGSFENENDNEMFSDEEIVEREEPQSSANDESFVEENTSSPAADGIRRSNRRRKATAKVWIVKNSKEEASRKGGFLYECSDCGKGSNFTSNLYKHMKNNHVGYEIVKLNENAGKNKSNHTPAIASGPSPKKVAKRVRSSGSFSITDNRTARVIKSTPDEIKNGAKPYKCSVCGKETAFSSNLYSHMKSVHKGYRIEKIWDSKK